MHIFSSGFSFIELISLLAGVFLILSGVFCHEFINKKGIGILILIIGGLILRVLFSLTDNFFNLWDEQYHGLVAKHLMENPLKPILYKNPALPYYYPDWGTNHIWLHKQPLFLWQISLSFKIFGISPFTLRIPSIILSSVLIYLVYDISKMLINSSVAILASAFTAGNNLLLKLVSGSVPTDHNDVAFIFYVTASIWALIIYLKNPKIKWLLIIGIFAGFAVLNKWVLGLLVYLIWGGGILFSEKRKDIASYKNLLISLFITFLISLPWQFYIHWAFPKESNWESYYNALHFFQVIEGHGGDYSYHIDKIKTIYGNISVWLIPIAFIFSVFDKNIKNKSIVLSTWVAVFFVYIFFSIAKTKMQAFTMIVFPLMVALVSLSIIKLIPFIFGILKLRLSDIFRKIAIFALFVIVFFQALNFNNLEENYTRKNIDVFNKRIHWNNFYNISNQLKDLLNNNEDYVIFNYPRFQNISCMILTNYTVYDYKPEVWHYFFIKMKGRKIAVLDFDDLPDFFVKTKDVLKIKMIKDSNTNLYSVEKIYY